MRDNYQKEGYKHKVQESEGVNYRPLLSNGIICKHCNQVVSRDYELCPKCGSRLHSNHCTFCGAPMANDDLYCGECGGDTKGITCPLCGSISFRSFCPNCNHAVDDLGKSEIERAKNDPLFIKICKLAENISKSIENKSVSEEAVAEIPSEIYTLIEKYRQLNDNQSLNSKIEDEFTPQPQIIDSESDLNAEGIRLSESGEIDLTAAVAELNALLKSMVPDPGLTPQMQRNYFSARKVAVFHKSVVREPIGWVCNLCGCQHNSPSECARPELGGTWIYQNKEITTKTYE